LINFYSFASCVVNVDCFSEEDGSEDEDEVADQIGGADELNGDDESLRSEPGNHGTYFIIT